MEPIQFASAEIFHVIDAAASMAKNLVVLLAGFVAMPAVFALSVGFLIQLKYQLGPLKQRPMPVKAAQELETKEARYQTYAFCSFLIGLMLLTMCTPEAVRMVSAW